MLDGKIIAILIVLFIIRGIVCGKATNKVLLYRGYVYDDWFLVGFFLGIVPLLVAMSRPDNNANYIKMIKAHKVETTSSATNWKCKKCRKINPAYTGTCSCGNTREENDAPLRALQAKREAEARALEEAKLGLDSELDNLLTLSAYKDLLDKGVISAADFEERKKELLP